MPCRPILIASASLTLYMQTGIVTMDAQIRSDSRRLRADDCTAAQRAIDAKLDAVPPSSSSEFGRELRTRRNAYALINAWLPAEIMVAIFYEIIATSRLTEWVYGGGYLGFNFSRTWVVITHVCQTWRMIAIGASRLWEAISFVNPEITAIMLQRSSVSPISIDYRSQMGAHKSINALPLALSQSDRAFEIILILPPRMLQDVFSRYLSKPMPFLKRLELGIGRAMVEKVQCFLPPGCLEGTKCLHDLVLLMVGILPNSILPTTLTQLVLWHLPKKFTVRQMLVLLEPLENLRDLSIEDALCSDIAGFGFSDLYRLSPRPHFRRLRLSAAADECTDFIRRFPITSATQTTLHSFRSYPAPVRPHPVAVPPSPEELRHFHFGKLLGPVYSVPGLLRGLRISYSDIAYPDKVRIDTYLGSSLPAVPSELCFSVSVRPWLSTPRGSWYELLCELCAHMQMDSVEAVAIEHTLSRDEGLAKATARILASQFHGVRMLSACSMAMKHLLRVMHPQDDGNGPAFPCLRALKVDGSSRSDEEEKEMLISIADCLIARKGSSRVADVEEVGFYGNVVPREYVEDLENLKSWKPPARIDKPSRGLGPQVIEQRRWSWSRPYSS